MLTPVVLVALWILATSPVSAEGLETWLRQIVEKVQRTFSPPPDMPNGARTTVEVWLLPGGGTWALHTARPSISQSYDFAGRHAVLSAAPLPMPTDPLLAARMRVLTVEFEGKTARVTKAEPLRKTPPVPVAFVLACPSGPALPADEPACEHAASESKAHGCFREAWQQRMDLLVKRCSRAAYPWEAQLRCWEGTTMVEQHFGEDGRGRRPRLPSAAGGMCSTRVRSH
jgi:hypothetical protein